VTDDFIDDAECLPSKINFIQLQAIIIVMSSISGHIYAVMLVLLGSDSVPERLIFTS
jgi:hypothetical protein